MTMENTFDYHPRTRLIFGNNAVDRIGALAKERHGSRILLVTDPGIAKAGHLERVERSKKAGFEPGLFLC